MNQKLINHPFKSRAPRSVEVLRNGQVILCWESIVLHMRTADLLVLNHALRSWMENEEKNWAQQYILWLSDCAMFFMHDQLYHFCSVVEQAAEAMPNRVVRWADLEVQIVPLGATDYKKRDCLSLN